MADCMSYCAEVTASGAAKRIFLLIDAISDFRGRCPCFRHEGRTYKGDENKPCFEDRMVYQCNDSIFIVSCMFILLF